MQISGAELVQVIIFQGSTANTLLAVAHWTAEDLVHHPGILSKSRQTGFFTPKSSAFSIYFLTHTLMWKSASTRMFSGFRSLWTKPCSCR